MFGLLKGMIGKVAKLVTGGGGKAVATVAAGGALGAVGSALIGTPGIIGASPVRRRRRRRSGFTNKNISDLLVLKAAVGPRSPLVLIAGLKMLR